METVQGDQSEHVTMAYAGRQVGMFVDVSDLREDFFLAF